jgi:hypothetical protein
MRFSGQIRRLSFYLLLLVVYSMVFCVQLLSHYDVAGNVYLHYGKSSGKGTALAAQKAGIQKAQHSVVKKVAVKLNKRFQPKSILSCTTCINELRVVHFVKPFSYSYPDPYTGDSFSGIHLQRGPPVTA